MAALLHEVVAVEWDESDDGSFLGQLGLFDPESRTPAVPKPQLDPVLKEWMTELGKAVQLSKKQAVTEYPPEVSKRLIFVLKVQQKTLRMEPTVAQVKPKGGYQSGQKIYIAYLTTGGSVERVGLVGDLALLRELQARQPAFGTHHQFVF